MSWTKNPGLNVGWAAMKKGWGLAPSPLGSAVALVVVVVVVVLVVVVL